MKPEPCGCEHADHFPEHPLATRLDHEYLAVPAGSARAMYVGLVCDSCAMGHMAPYVVSRNG